MFDQNTLAVLEANYNAMNPQKVDGPYQAPKKEKKQVGGIKGFAARALPWVGGGVGAALGSLVAPVAGTAAGGAAGSAAGTFLKQKILGEDTNFGEIGKEAALGAVPGVFKGVSGVVRGVKGAKAAREAQAIEEANRAAQATERTGILGRSAIGGTLSGQRAFLTQQADEATRFNDLARQNIQKVASERAAESPTVARGIPIQYTESVSRGTGVPRTANKALFNPTVSEIENAAGDLAAKGYSTTSKVGQISGRQSAPGGGQSIFQPAAPSSYVQMKGTKTAVPLTTTTERTSVLQPKAQPAPPTQKAPSFASEGVELKPVPQVPEVPQRFAQPFGNTPRPTPSAPVSTQVPSAKPGVVQRTKQGATNASQSGYGLTVGQSAGRGQVLTPDKADETYNFITKGSQKYGGIRPGKPIDQARDAQNVFNNVKTTLDDTLTKIDRPLQVHEPINITANAMGKVRDNPAVTGTTKTLEKFDQKIKNAKSLKELEAIRREADDLAYTAAGAGKTSAAAQAKAVRESIDDFITPMSPEYKAIKGDYTLARDALETTAKANKSAKGFKLPFVDTEIGKQAIPGVKNKVSAKVAGTPPPGAPPVPGEAPTGFRPYVKPIAQQGVTRLAISPFLAAPPTEEESTVPTVDEMQAGATAPPVEQPQDQGAMSAFNDPEKLQAAYLQALISGDKETAQLLLSGYEAFGKMKEQKPLSAEASKVIANANSGLQSLDIFKQQMQEDPSARVKSAIPGREAFGGLGASLLGTSSYDTASKNIADVITRLRTGAAITESEEKFYRAQLPQAFDPPETVQIKIKMFEDLFSSVANRTGTAGTDVQAAVGM